MAAVKFKDLFKLEPVDNSTEPNSYTLIFGDKDIGKIIRDVDGYYYYWPDREYGSWESHTLMAIAEILNDLNREWDNEVKKAYI